MILMSWCAGCSTSNSLFAICTVARKSAIWSGSVDEMARSTVCASFWWISDTCKCAPRSVPSPTILWLPCFLSRADFKAAPKFDPGRPWALFPPPILKKWSLTLWRGNYFSPLTFIFSSGFREAFLSISMPLSLAMSSKSANLLKSCWPWSNTTFLTPPSEDYVSFFVKLDNLTWSVLT